MKWIIAPTAGRGQEWVALYGSHIGEHRIIFNASQIEGCRLLREDVIFVHLTAMSGEFLAILEHTLMRNDYSRKTKKTEESAPAESFDPLYDALMARITKLEPAIREAHSAGIVNRGLSEALVLGKVLKDRGYQLPPSIASHFGWTNVSESYV